LGYGSGGNHDGQQGIPENLDGDEHMTTRQSGKRPGAPRDKVHGAVRQLKEMYAEGQQLWKRFAKPAKDGATKIARIEKEAEKRGTNTDYLWKRLAVTNPVTGFSSDELDQLCKCAIENRRIVGMAMVAKLLSVAKQHRMRFATKILREGWSLSEVDAALIRRHGRRRQGGRRPRLLLSVEDLLVGIDGKCLGWSKLYDWLCEPPDAAPPGRHLIHWNDLPENLQEALVGIIRAAERLRGVVSAHLGQSKPRRRATRT
jgi:hypothetical protein